MQEISLLEALTAVACLGGVCCVFAPGSVQGLWFMCRGEKTPWGTHIGGEEYPPDCECPSCRGCLACCQPDNLQAEGPSIRKPAAFCKDAFGNGMHGRQSLRLMP